MYQSNCSSLVNTAITRSRMSCISLWSGRNLSAIWVQSTWRIIWTRCCIGRGIATANLSAMDCCGFDIADWGTERLSFLICFCLSTRILVSCIYCANIWFPCSFLCTMLSLWCQDWTLFYVFVWCVKTGHPFAHFCVIVSRNIYSFTFKSQLSCCWSKVWVICSYIE